MNYRLILLAAASATTLIADAAFAQDAAPADTTVEEVVVTGSRAPRVRLETVSPVDVVSSKEMAQQATTETAQALANIAPSINFPRPSITDGTDSVRPATLRGLSPDQTLVLVNGVRQHASALVNINGSIGRGSAAVDLNTIPIAALSTVEVLRDGASAQYGSDAIAGVINLRLREARDGGAITLHAGMYDTDVKPARIPGGYHKNDGAVIELSGWKGYSLPANGFMTITAELRSRQPTSRSDLDPRQGPPPFQIRSRYGDAEARDATLFFNAGVDLNPTWQGYGWLGVQRRETESAATGRIPSNVNNDLTIYPNGFIPLIAPTIDDLTSVVGLKGDLGGYQTDFNIGYGRNHIQYRVKNSINGSLIPNSPTEFDAGQLRYDQLTIGLDVVKPLMDIGTFEETTIAFGGEFRNERYRVEAGEPASYIQGPRTGSGIGPGAQGFTGLAPANEGSESRHSYSLYGDLDVRVTKAFDIDVAARLEDYSDFGTTTTGKLAMRYDFTDSFAIRGAVSTGFRAPALQQSAFSSTAINFINIGTPAVSTPFNVITLRPESALAASFGAKPLQPEESVNYSAGFVFHTGPFELTVDGYKILIDDRIVLSENLLGSPADNPTRIAINNLLNPTGGTLGGARFFINGVDSETKGLDIVGRYRLVTDHRGSFAFTLAANFNDTKITRVPAIPTGVPIPNPPALFNRINILSFEEGTPHSKVTAGLDWTGGAFGASVKATYYESILHPFSNTDLSQDVHTGDHIITDVEGRYRIRENINVAVGVNNLFDEYPDATPAIVNTNGALAWSNYSPFGFNGRFLYTRLGYNF